MNKAGGLLAIFAVLAVSGCTQPPGQYKLSLREVYTRLVASELPDYVADQQCGLLIHVRTDGVPDKSVTWHISSSGKELLRLTAQLAPVDAGHTRVDIAVSREPDGREAYDGSRTYIRPAVRQPVRPAIDEQVAALLEDRRLDPARIPEVERDTVCNVQRAGLEAGLHWSINDRPSMTSEETIAADAADEREREEQASAARRAAADAEARHRREMNRVTAPQRP